MSDTVVDGAEDQQHSRAPARSARALADRYVALWNESDGEARRSLIRELWTSTGEHVLDPPHELKEASAALGFASPTLEVRGHEAVETRAARAYEEFIAPGEYAFRLRDNVASLRNVVKFNWDMVATASGDVVGSGLEISSWTTRAGSSSTISSSRRAGTPSGDGSRRCAEIRAHLDHRHENARIRAREITRTSSKCGASRTSTPRTPWIPCRPSGSSVTTATSITRWW
jgi:hypothetical protein